MYFNARQCTFRQRVRTKGSTSRCEEIAYRWYVLSQNGEWVEVEYQHSSQTILIQPNQHGLSDSSIHKSPDMVLLEPATVIMHMDSAVVKSRASSMWLIMQACTDCTAFNL